MLLILCMVVTSVYAMPEIDTQLAGSKVEITISGTLSDAAQGKPVALTIYREGETAVLHVDQMISGEGGSYRFRFTGNPDWRGGRFRYEITSLEAEKQSGPLELPDVKIKGDLLEKIHAAQSAADVQQAMEGKELGLNLPVYDEISKTDVYNGLYEFVKAGGRFKDLNEMDAKIKEFTVLAALNQNVSGITDAGKLQYLGMIGVSEEAVQQYRNNLSNKGIAGVNGLMLGKGFTSAQSAAQRFEAALYTNLITGYKSVGTGHVEAILQQQGSKLGIDYSAYVAKGKPASVRQALVNSGATTPEALAAAFTTALNAVGSGSGNGTGGGGTGGASGGGGGSHSVGGGVSTGGSYLPPVSPTTPLVTPEPSNQPTAPGGFTDIGQVAWAKDAIVYLKQTGVINGKTETEFAPDDNVTREEFVKMLMTALKLTDDSPYVLPFGDVKEGDWYYDTIRAAAKNHIVSGMSDSWFGVGEDISRQDMVTIAFRALRLTNVTMDTDIAAMAFEDQTMIAEYAMPAARVFKKMNLVKGYEDGAFRPLAKTTRAEAAKLIYNMLQLKGVAQ